MPSFGIAKQSANALVTFAASMNLLPANPSRRMFIVSNTGANIVWLELQTDSQAAPSAVIGEGIAVLPNTVFKLEEYQGPVAARAAVADVTVGLVEI